MLNWFNTRTAELVAGEIELLEVREVADRLRDGACARAREFCVCLVQHTRTRTAELVAKEIERLQVREVADRLRDGACAWAREFLCMSGSTNARVSPFLLRR